MLDLVDIFGPSSEPLPPSTDPWNSAQPVCDITSDPWDTVGGWLTVQALPSSRSSWCESCYLFMSSQIVTFTFLPVLTAVHSSTPVIGSPWMAPHSSSNTANPWAPCTKSHTDPWEEAPVSSSPVNHVWDSPTDGGTVFSVCLKREVLYSVYD